MDMNYSHGLSLSQELQKSTDQRKLNSSGHKSETDETHQEIQDGIRPGYARLFRTACVVALFMVSGLAGGVVTTTNVDLVDVIGASIDRLSAAASVRAFGQMGAAFLVPYILKRYRRYAYLIVAISTVVEGVGFAVIPLMRHLWGLFVLMIFRGFVHGIAFVIAGTLIIADWGSESSTTMNALYLGFSVGLLIGPMMSAPFLSQEILTNSTMNITMQTESRIIIPYSLSGAISMIPALGFFVIFIKHWDTPISQQSVEVSITSSINRRMKPTKYVVAFMLLLIYIVIELKESLITAFLFYIAVEGPLHIPKTHAAALNTLNSASWVIGRLFGTFLTRCLPIHLLLFAVLVLSYVLSVLLVFYGLQAELYLWVLACLIQIFSGPTNATIITWADRYIHITGFFMSIKEFAAGSGEFTMLIAGGLILERFGAHYVFITASAAALLVLVLVSVLQICFSCKLTDRYKRENVILCTETTENTPLLS